MLGTDGKILVSTKEKLVGTREEEQVMAELLTLSGDEGAVVQVDEPDFWEQPACFLCGGVGGIAPVRGGSPGRGHGETGAVKRRPAGAGGSQTGYHGI